MLVMALLLVGTSPSPAGRQDVENAWSSLNRYVETISHGDACLDRSDMRLVERLDPRIDAVRVRAVAEYPGIDLEAGKGDTDYLCTRRSDERPHVSRRAIRSELDRLIRDIEDLLPAAPANVR